MSNYNKITDYAAKDSLSQGDAVKRVKGSEIGADFDAVAVAVATKANSASPVFTGVSGFAVGAVGAPSIYMTGYATTGWYNIGANNWGFAVSGAKVLDVSSTGLAVTGALSCTEDLIVNSGVAATEFLILGNRTNTLANRILLRNGSTHYAWKISTQDSISETLEITPSTAVGGDTFTTPIVAVSPTGLAVTGTLTATGVSKFAAGTVGAPSIYLSTDTTTGWYRIGANNVGFAVSGAKVLDIASTGLAVTGTTSTTTGMAVGGATAGAGGIAFPATAVAVGDVNTLDDYEEGTFTPVLGFGGGTTGITYAIQSGSYTKIGNRVEWSCYIVLTSKGSSTGTAAISGLPFASANSDNAYASASVRASVVTYAGMIMVFYPKNTATVSFEQLSEAGSNTSMTDANFANTSTILLSGSYRV